MKVHPLKYERERRGWSQAKLAQEIGVYPATIGRWERGISLPYPFYREQLCTIFGKSARELGLLPEREQETSASSVQAPFSALSPDVYSEPILDPFIPVIMGGKSCLIDREAFLALLKEWVCGSEHLTFGAIHGLPGCGKTALAMALVADPQIHSRFHDGILWAGLGPHPNMLGVLSRWGRLLGISPKAADDTSSLRFWEIALREAIGLRHMLLVIDDAWDAQEALALQIGGPHCAYLLTTRQARVAVDFAGEGAFQVPELDEADGVRLLARFAPQVVAYHPTQAYQLVRLVGALPLALVLVGKSLGVQTYSGQPRRLRSALAQLQAAERRLYLSKPVAPLERPLYLPAGAPLSLAAAIAVSDQRLDEQARRTLHALSVLPARPNSFSEEAALAVAAVPVEVLDTLNDTGLLESREGGRYTLHQTIADYARTQLEEAGGRAAAQERLMTYGIDYVERHMSDNEAIERESSTILAALEAAFVLGRRADLVRGICAIACFLQRYGVSTLVTRHVMCYEVTRPLRDILSTGSPMFLLGTLLQQWGDRTRVETYLQEGLTIACQRGDCEQIGNLLISLGWIVLERSDFPQGELRLKHGQQAEATDAFRMLLKLTTEGNPDFPNQAWACYGLARAAALQGEMSEACQYAQASLEYFEQAGSSHAAMIRTWLEQLRTRDEGTANGRSGK